MFIFPAFDNNHSPSVVPITGSGPTTSLHPRIEVLPNPTVLELSKIDASFWLGFSHRKATQQTKVQLNATWPGCTKRVYLPLFKNYGYEVGLDSVSSCNLIYRSCLDRLNSLRIILEQSPLHLVFIDLSWVQSYSSDACGNMEIIWDRNGWLAGLDCTHNIWLMSHSYNNIQIKINAIHSETESEAVVNFTR